MKKASEYREHAAECRAMADQVARPDHREQLLEMARTWDTMADEREKAERRKRRTESDK